jgi:Zn-dependent oligopeptidase
LLGIRNRINGRTSTHQRNKQNKTKTSQTTTTKPPKKLRNAMRVDDDEAARAAAYQGLRSIGPFVAEPLCEIVKLRNRLAKLLGYEDYYDYKVRRGAVR